jgi:hypothetical protein
MPDGWSFGVERHFEERQSQEQDIPPVYSNQVTLRLPDHGSARAIKCKKMLNLPGIDLILDSRRPKTSHCPI